MEVFFNAKFKNYGSETIIHVDSDDKDEYWYNSNNCGDLFNMISANSNNL